MNSKWAFSAIGLYIVGMLVFYRWGQLNTNWYEYYYIWDKSKDVLFLIGIYYLVPRWFRLAVVPVIIFSLVRLLWQIISTFTGLNINNTKVIGWLFVILAASCFCLFLIGLKHSPKRR